MVIVVTELTKLLPVSCTLTFSPHYKSTRMRTLPDSFSQNLTAVRASNDACVLKLKSHNVQSIGSGRMRVRRGVANLINQHDDWKKNLSEACCHIPELSPSSLGSDPISISW